MRDTTLSDTRASITLEKLLAKTPKLRAKIQTSISEHNLAMKQCSQLTPTWLAKVTLALINYEYKCRILQLQDRVDKDSDYEGNSTGDINDIVTYTLNVLIAYYRETLKNISFLDPEELPGCRVRKNNFLGPLPKELIEALSLKEGDPVLFLPSPGPLEAHLCIYRSDIFDKPSKYS